MTQEEIEDLVFEKINEILLKEKCKSVRVVIGTFNKYGYTTDDRIMSSVDNSLIIANTTIAKFKGDNNYYPTIIIFEDNLVDIEKQTDKQTFVDEIDRVLKHEIWHCEQFRWLYEHGGFDALKKANDADLNAGYPNGVLERGAIDYSENGIKQDFEKTLSQFI